MSNSEEDEDHSSAIRTPGQLITALVAAFVFPVTIFMLLGQYVTGDQPIDPNSPAYSNEAVVKRLKPVGELVLADESTPQAEAQSTGASGQATLSAEAPAGPAEAGEERIKSIYTASCAACHASGAAGAPKLGDKVAWAARIKTGSEGLYNSALKGKNAMPPKGGNASLSDAEVKAVVDYMVSQSK
ncbi:MULTISPECIES: c-type cytochrome [unclassified Nitrosospira]|uniref:c-type cytochrome n=1 Tax=unclassified Nitrosospira TaxID=2609267 RepID=UPI000D313232|nr:MULTISPECIES: c-type cytochrome [unclassified Nitrosospira]PTR15018.1 cytochrome c5 [Nitrosospira sp. Nsp2]WON72568.1 c-type cytochrome [Nitrosospira sp. Is2]